MRGPREKTRCSSTFKAWGREPSSTASRSGKPSPERNSDGVEDGGRSQDQPDSAQDRSSSREGNPGTSAEGPSFQDWRNEIQDLFRNVLEEHRLDGLFFPQAGAPIPDLIEDPDRPDYNPNNHPELPSNIINDMGLPVVTLPFAYYEDKTPFVLAFIGDVWTEGELLAYAFDLERATRARIPPVLERNPGSGERP